MAKRGAAPSWRNRIVGYGDVDPKTLVPNPQNYRRHPKAQADATAGSLGELGWIQDVLVNRTSGRLIDGHLRVELALQSGAQSVPVKYVELSEAEERLALATLDPLTYMAETDAAALGALLEGVNTEDEALSAFLGQMSEENLLAQTQADTGDGFTLGEMSKSASTAKVVLPISDAGVLERALLATGENNRATALSMICRAFLGEGDE